MRIFISSAQKEFDEERAALGEFIGGEVLLSKFYEAFIFERDIPAAPTRRKQPNLPPEEARGTKPGPSPDSR